MILPVPAVTRIKRTVTVLLCACQWCGHRWESLNRTRPKTCANVKCRAREWYRVPRFRHK